MTGSARAHATRTPPSPVLSLPPRPVATAAGALDPDHVPCMQLAREFRRLLFAVHERPPGQTVSSRGRAAGRMPPPLGEDGEPAVLEHAQLADDAVAAAVR